MNPFTYSRAADADQAVTAISSKPQGKFLGGGTNLIDLMKMGVETPNELVDINRLPLGQIEELPDKGLRIGALARNSDVAKHELINAVDLPAMPLAARSHYLKVRDRASYAFALVSVAAALDLDPNKKINAVRIALGGVAHKPWRASAAEKELIGKTADEKAFRAAAEAELAAAKGYKYNSFKIELAKRAIVRALNTVATMTG